MKLILLFAISTLIVGRINAAPLSETQHVTNDYDKLIEELFKAKEENDGLSAAAEYFKAPQATKKNFESKTRERFAAAAEYFKAPEASERQSYPINEVALANGAEYFKAPEIPNNHEGVDQVAESLAAAAEYLRAPELSRRTSGTKEENALAAAAEYFKTPESTKLSIKNDQAAESLAAAAAYFAAPEYHTHLNVGKKYFAAARRPMLRPTMRPPRQHFIRLGLF